MKLKAGIWLALWFFAAAFPLARASGEVSTSEACLARAAESELHKNILPFWLKYAPDHEHGGFQGQVDEDFSTAQSAPRGALLTCRILWSFSAAYRRDHCPEYLQMAHRAFADLQNRFWDDQHGGLYWTVSADGKPRDTTKHVYGQVFGIYALSEYYRATSEKAALAKAVTLYRLLEAHARDKIHGGYFEVFTRDWHPARQRESVISPYAAKSQNTHLHVMEAYANLLSVWPDEGLKHNLQTLVELMLTRIYDSNTHHLRLFMDDDWKPKSNRCSYGHDIEASWLMTEAAGVLGDHPLVERTRHTALEIAEATLKEGIDADGGIFNEGGPQGVTDFNKDWWPQAEAVVGFVNAYQISGDNRFLTAASRTWKFIETRIVDHSRGEWWQSVSRAGEPELAPKISLWKCPYHNSRACLEIMDRLAVAPAEKK